MVETHAWVTCMHFHAPTGKPNTPHPRPFLYSMTKGEVFSSLFPFFSLFNLMPDAITVRGGAVGQFKQLVEFSNQDPRFTDKLKQYLIPNKARDHVALAVENDKRLRMWYPEPNNVEGGLLFRSVRARVDLEHPDGQYHFLYAPYSACLHVSYFSL